MAKSTVCWYVVREKLRFDWKISRKIRIIKQANMTFFFGCGCG
jgi:hypothetical protein